MIDGLVARVVRVSAVVVLAAVCMGVLDRDQRVERREVWIDRDELDLGGDLKQRLEEAHALVLLVCDVRLQYR